jgi:hypothetical protein
MARLKRASAAALVGLLIADCSTGRPLADIEPSQYSISSGSEMSYGGDGYNIWVMNSSTKPIMVTGVLLHDCENIRSECGTATRLQVRVEPGRRQTVYTVRTSDRGRPSTFRFSYTWSGAPSR